MTTYTGTGFDSAGNAINFTLTATIVPFTYYVSAAGNDANDGKTPSTAWQTIAKVNSVVLARGGSVLFRCGDSFTGMLVPNIDGNGDPNNPVVIGSYPNGPIIANPVLTAGAGGDAGVVEIAQMSGITVRGLTIRGGDLAHMPRGGIKVWNNSAVRRTGILIDNCDIGSICYFEATMTPTTQGTEGFGIYLAGWPGTGGFDINITNTKVHGINGVGSHDDVGIGGWGNGSNVGINCNNVEVFNIGGGPPGLNPGFAYPPMGDGFGITGCSGGLIQNCSAHDCGWNYRNAGGGPAGFLCYQSNNVRFYKCKAWNIVPSDFSLIQNDFIGFDIDDQCTNCVIDTCYATNCYNSGFMFFGQSGWNNNTITNCISENNCRSGQPGFGEIRSYLTGAQNPTVTVTNNTTFNNRVFNGVQGHNDNQGAPGLALVGDGILQGTISKNIHIVNQDVYFVGTPLNARTNTSTWTPAVDISNNAWFDQSGKLNIWWGNVQYFSWQETDAVTLSRWQAASGKGANTQTGDPHFTAVGTGPAGYVQTTYPGWGATPAASYGSA